MSQTETLIDQRARARIAGCDPADLTETLFVEAGAGSGKTRSLVARTVALVGAGIEIRHIAAITFTEKAAGELRNRIRRELEEQYRREPNEPRWRVALDQLDAAAIGTLHAFAQRLLTERPIEAGLPPNFEVLDEVGSEIEFNDRWEQFRAGLLNDERLQRTLLLGFAAGLRLDHLRSLATIFDANWDLLNSGIPWEADAVEPPPVDAGELMAGLEAICARSDECRDADDGLLKRLGELREYAERLRTAPDEYEVLRLLGEDKPSFKSGIGRQANWPDAASVRQQITDLGAKRGEVREQVAEACLKRLAVSLRDFTLVAAGERRTEGRLEFHDLLVLARALLRGEQSDEARSALRRRYRRLLLDEFQDTDPIQIELAVLLASGDAGAHHRPWPQVRVEPGRLFFVGDPKQSIYRFRRADIALFLDARKVFSNGQPLHLTTNFRTTPPVLDWINHVFGRLIIAEEGSQPAYEPLTAAPSRTRPTTGPSVALLGAEPHTDPDLRADDLREREATDVAAAIVSAINNGWAVSDRDGAGQEHWRDARLGDIAVLIPARTSLPALERALEAHEIAYRAETTSLVYSTPEIRDLFASLRAVADPTDELSLVTALRSPLFGCGDDDLAVFRLRYQGRWNIEAPLPDDLPRDHPVAEGLDYLRQLHDQSQWLAPSELLSRITVDRRMFELGFADGRPRDLWRRLRFVIDQAREWSEANPGTLRQYLAWSKLQASESARVAETVLPETDDDSVRILTIHGAKGLEFPITIVSGLTTQVQARRVGVQVVWPPNGPAGLKISKQIFTTEFEDFKPIDEQMDYHERLRLLYVACTRAQDHLVVSLHRKQRKSAAKPGGETSAELLYGVCADAPHQQWLDLQPNTPLAIHHPSAQAPPPLPAHAVWRAESTAALRRGSAPRTVAATSISELAEIHGADLAEDPGLAKQPRDLDLPPWIKGRYGTAIGRAVHAVLQTIDLETGDGLDDAVAAQAAAEAVIGREGDIAMLVRAALRSSAVQESLRYERWRETYVAAPVGAVTLEGYVDLLYRTPRGLVVVDYKTASSADDLGVRAAGYRLQAGAYACALEEATGEAVARCVFVFLTPSGAIEHEVDDLAGVVDDVRGLLAVPDTHRFRALPDPGDPIPA